MTIILGKRYYIYRHVRPDTNQVFYVGRGMEYTCSTPLRRAFDTRRRNKYWEYIVRKNNGMYDVEIMFWSDSRDEILRKEQEFIALYGRMDRGGTLANFTDGGDGSYGLKHSEEVKAKIREMRKTETWRTEMFRSEEFKKRRLEKVVHLPGTMLGRKHSEETKRLMSMQRNGGLHPEAKKVIDTSNGIVYGCVREAANATGIGRGSLYQQLSGNRRNRTSLQYLPITPAMRKDVIGNGQPLYFVEPDEGQE